MDSESKVTGIRGGKSEKIHHALQDVARASANFLEAFEGRVKAGSDPKAAFSPGAGEKSIYAEALWWEGRTRKVLALALNRLKRRQE